MTIENHILVNSSLFFVQGIPVVAITPGMVSTDFGMMPNMLKNMGGRPTNESVEGVIQIMDGLSMERGEGVAPGTGEYWSVKWDSDGKPVPPVPFAAGW